MELPIYETFRDFKENYIADFTNQNGCSYYSYLNDLSKLYSGIHANKINENEDVYESIRNTEYSVLQSLEPLLPADVYLILFHDLWADYSNETEDAVIENPSLFFEIIDADLAPGTFGLLCDFFEQKKKQKDIEKQNLEITNHYLDYLRFIENEKKEIEIQIKRPQTISELQPSQIVRKPKPRTADINFKFALLEEMGVIQWLKTNILTNHDDRAEILQQLIGGSTESIKNYLKGQTINKDVKQKALDLLNEKRFKH